MTTETKSPGRRSGRRLLWLALIPLLLLAGAGSWVVWRGSTEATKVPQVPTYEVGRGDLTVTVSAGGTIQAMETYDVESKVEGQSQILYVIPEGTVLTKKDVEEGKVLVRLDSSGLEDKESQQSISVEDAQASLTQAREAYAIQEQENESSLSAARLNVKFARLEIQRYLGQKLADKVAENGMDFSTIGSLEGLGGQAKQQKRELEAAVMLADEELSRAEETLEWTRKLVEKGYVNRNEEVADELQVKRRQTELQKAQAELDLFLRYTLPKEAEARYEDLRETMRELERVKARCRSELAQAQSQLRSRQVTYQSKKERLEKIQEMIDNSVIRAQKTGMVLYASTINPRRYRNNPIQEGANIREGQTIISIPDLSTLGARVEINETEIRSVKVGQPAVITVQAIGNQSFQGRVARVSPMAKSEHRWLNPDVMVYDTDVALAEPRGEIQPGMSATTEVVVADLKDVIAIPVQAVTTRKGRRVCWVATGTGLRLQEVETGHFTDTRVEIVRGLEPGEDVLLAAPDVPGSDVDIATLPEPEEDETDETAMAGGRDDAGSGEKSSSGEPPREGPNSKDNERRGRRNISTEQMLAFVRRADPERKKAIIKRIRERISSLPEEKRKEIEQKLSQLTEESGEGSR
jgi:RND family efflux transporter MFP subunit